MKIAVIQMKAFDIRDYKKCAGHILDMIKRSAEGGADLVLLPECAYPAYVINDKEVLEEALEEENSLIEKMKSMAENRFYIAAGMVIRENNAVKNAAIVIGKNGKIIHTHIKSNMWHFDSDFYMPGEQYDIFETEFGKMGVIVCADGRTPEIAAILAKKGAELIINLANLTSAGFNAESLTNPQTEYMLPSRSRENNVYMAVCCKAGLENNILNNAGGSCVISPEGVVIDRLPSNKEDILFAEIDINKRNAAVPKKRPDLYGILTEKTENTGAADFMERKFLYRNTAQYVSAVSYRAEDIESYTDKARKYIDLCRVSHSNFVMLPQTGFACNAKDVEKNISALLKPKEFALVSSYYIEKNKYAVLISKNGVEVVWNKTGDEGGGYFYGETSFGRIGVIFEDEIFIPEISRVYMLEGCSAVFIYANEKSDIADRVIRSRAAENKIYVMASYGGSTMASQLISPEGNVVFSTLKDTEQICGGYIHMYNAAFKDVVPGTNVVTGRRPESYRILTKK